MSISHRSFWILGFLSFLLKEKKIKFSLVITLGGSFQLRDKMLEGKAHIEDTDMPIKMQIQAMTSASHALDLYDVFDCKSIAFHIKKEFDKIYGDGWQCVVGSNFGCYFTHSKGTFIYFALETLNFLIYKGASSSSSSPTSS